MASQARSSPGVFPGRQRQDGRKHGRFPLILCHRLRVGISRCDHAIPALRISVILSRRHFASG
eukprot:1040194-Pyramimonas_sp.AAC.1